MNLSNIENCIIYFNESESIEIRTYSFQKWLSSYINLPSFLCVSLHIFSHYSIDYITEDINSSFDSTLMSVTVKCNCISKIADEGIKNSKAILPLMPGINSSFTICFIAYPMMQLTA